MTAMIPLKKSGKTIRKIAEMLEISEVTAAAVWREKLAKIDVGDAPNYKTVGAALYEAAGKGLLTYQPGWEVSW